MLILDTHVWLWWLADTPRLTEEQRQAINEHRGDLIGICSFSCWEISKLVERGKLNLPVDLAGWFRMALDYPSVELLFITTEIAIESNRLPGDFRRDPADQIIVATARVYQCPLATSDSRIRSYPHVETVY